jgi:predicted ferric reductase
MAELMLLARSSGHGMLALARMDAAATSPLMWYVTRTCALAAYVLLTASVALGMLQSIARRSGEHLSWLADELHQFLATLAGVLIAAHVVTLVLDDYLPFSVANIVLPLAEPYRAFPVSLGVFALYGMALLLFSSWLRRRIPYRLWRGIHYVSFLTISLVTAHGLLAGSDTGELWMRGVYGAAIGGLGFALLVRTFFARPTKKVRSTEILTPTAAVRRVRPQGRIFDV